MYSVNTKSFANKMLVATMKYVKSTGGFGLVVLALLTVQTGFGLYPVIAKRLGVGSTGNPLVFCMVRDACSFPVLVLLSLISEGWLGIPKWRDCLIFGMLGVIGIYLNQLFYLLGVTYIGANITTIFQQLIPIWTTFLTIITCTERVPSVKTVPTWLKLFGTVLAIGGAVEISLLHSNTQNTNSSQQSHAWLGYLCVIPNTFLLSAFIVLQKKYIFDQPDNQWRGHPIWVITWSYLAGAVCISLSSLYYVNTPSAFYISLDMWGALIYAIIITSCLSYILITWASSKTNASIVAAFWPFQVVPCFIGSYLINGEVLIPLQYIGAVLVIAGLFSVVLGKYLEERRENSEQK